MPRPSRTGAPAREPNKRNLTELFLKKAAPQPRAVLTWDTHQRGLALQMQPTGRKSWKVIYRFGGRPRWYTIGDADAVGLADARRLAAKVMLAVAEGRDPAAERRALRTAGTFGELADKYRDHARRKNKSWRQADALVRKHLLPRWAKLAAAGIARGDVRAVVSSIAAPIAANQVLAAASAIFSWAVAQEVGGIVVNPCRGIERNPTKDRERILSDAEVPLFWGEFSSAGIPGAALKMLLLTGQRPGEVARMRTEHVEDGWWTLPGEPLPALRWPGTKNGATHRVWLPAPAQAILSEMSADGVVFAGPRGAPVEDIDATMRAICARLGAERATPHDLRRTHGSTITRLGFGRDAMNRVQNHREGGIASVYDRHQYAEENRRVMETVAAHVMALVTGEPAGKVLQFGR
jgi:integrase